MKITPLHTIVATFLVGVAGTLQAAQLDLRYEWAPSPAGPFSSIPADKLKVHGDGSISVNTAGPHGFFRLLIQAGDAGGGVAATPVRPLDALPERTLELARGFIESIAGEDSSEGAEWRDVSIAPFFVPITSSWNDTGVPDMAELKIVAECAALEAGAILPAAEAEESSTERGFLLVGLSRKSPPIVGYAVDGVTPAESLLQKCPPASQVHCIRRFGPMSLVAEDETVTPLANDGLIPVLFDDETYEEQSQPLSYTWNSETANPRFPDPRPEGVRKDFKDYRQLLAAYQGSEFLSRRRAQLQTFIEFDWQALEGTAPSLTVTPGERKVFLESEMFSRFSLDDEDQGRVASISLAAGGGVTIVGGSSSGAVKLTLFKADGSVRRFMVAVLNTTGGGGGGDTGLFITSKMWEAGSIESQPRFSQRADLDRWCPSVGCGPVMLALQVTWAEHYQNVPSAYWNRDPNATLASRRASLRDINSPLKYVKHVDNVRMMQWYDHFHDTCNVACWPHNGSGSSVPWDVGSSLINYTNYITGPLFPVIVGGDSASPLVGGTAHWEADVISDDWDESGVRTANAIKAGRPGGVLYLEHFHYCVAYRYRKTVHEYKANGQTLFKTTYRYFRVNTGWGASASKRDRVWNAYDIDGCYLLNLWQKRNLANP